MAKTRGSSTSKSGHQRGRSIPVDIPSTSNLHLNSNTRKRRAEETDNVQQRSVRYVEFQNCNSNKVFQVINIVIIHSHSILY